MLRALPVRRLNQKHSGLYDDCVAYFSLETHISPASGSERSGAERRPGRAAAMSLHMDVCAVFLAFFRKHGGVKHGEKLKLG